MQGKTEALLCQWFLRVGPSHSRRRASALVTRAEASSARARRQLAVRIEACLSCAVRTRVVGAKGKAELVSARRSDANAAPRPMIRLWRLATFVECRNWRKPTRRRGSRASRILLRKTHFGGRINPLMGRRRLHCGFRTADCGLVRPRLSV
jgi:hypothetical protein